MTDENYKKALHDAMHETNKLLAARSEIDRRLAQLKATVTVLFGLLEQPPKADEEIADIGDLGISEAIRKILRDAGVGLTPLEVKAKLGDAGVDLSKYANASAVIHNTLKRLESQGEVVAVNNPGGAAKYAIAPTTFADLGEQLAEYAAQITRPPVLRGHWADRALAKKKEESK